MKNILEDDTWREYSVDNNLKRAWRYVDMLVPVVINIIILRCVDGDQYVLVPIAVLVRTHSSGGRHMELRPHFGDNSSRSCYRPLQL